MYTLEEVVKAFESWRLTRVNKSEPIPEKLWAMTNSLVPYYKKSHIIRALRLSGRWFNTHCMSDKDLRVADANINGFAVGTFLPTTFINNEVCELTLKGVNKSLQIKINIQNLVAILPLMEKYL